MKIYSKTVLNNKGRETFKDEATGAVINRNAYNDVLREIDIMKRLENECLVRLHEVIDAGEDSDKLVMVMDYCEGGEIMSWDPEA